MTSVTFSIFRVNRLRRTRSTGPTDTDASYVSETDTTVIGSGPGGFVY